MSTELVTIQGREYEVSQPTNEDWEWLETAMRAEIIAPAKTAGLTGDDLLAVVRDAGKLQILSHTGLSWFTTKSGLSRLVYRCLKHKHPDIRLSECANWVYPDPQAELLAAVNRQAFERSLGVAKKNDQPTTEPATT